MDDVAWLIVWLIASLLCAGIGAYVSSERGREPFEGAAFGGLLGPLGVVVAALMPARPAAISRRSYGDVDDGPSPPDDRVPDLAAEPVPLAPGGIDLGIVPGRAIRTGRGPMTLGEIERSAEDRRAREAIRDLGGR